MGVTGNEGLYVAVIGDIRSSRNHGDRGKLQQRFADAIEAAADRRKRSSEVASPAAGPTITTGDEFQVLFQASAGVAPFLVDVTELMFPVRLRFGLGLGSLETPLREEAVGMDGPCFHEARSALERADEEDAWVRVAGFGGRFDPSLDAVFDLVAAVRDDWTDRQREFATAYRELGVQQAVADRFGVSKSTVSESLASAHVHEVHAAEAAIADLLAQAAQAEGAGT